MSFIHSFEIRPDSAGQPGTRPTRDRVEEKTDEGKTRCDPIDPLRPGCKLVDFCFFFLLKRRSFDFFLKKLTRSNPVTRLKPRTRALDRAES
jgi:hypothetical protein